MYVGRYSYKSKDRHLGSEGGGDNREESVASEARQEGAVGRGTDSEHGGGERLEEALHFAAIRIGHTHAALVRE